MSGSLVSVEDRNAITDTLLRYGTAIDEFDFEGVASVFTADADIEYRGHPPMVGGAEAGEFMRIHTAPTLWHQHMNSVARIEMIDADTVATLTNFIAHAVFKANTDMMRLSVGEYRDTLRRQADGQWLISERRQITGWKETRTRAQ